ncbi:MAG: endolytic transglycosylase MltG [Spirochaetales bacterium]
MKISTQKLTLGFVVLSLVVAVLGAVRVAWVLTVPVEREVDEDTVVEFPVQQGQSLRRVTENLAELGLIRDARIVEFYGRLTGQAAQVRAGTFPLRPDESAREILSEIVSGRAIDESIRVTIPEGWRLEQIAARLDGFGIVDSEEFLEAAVVQEEYRDFEVIEDLPDGRSLEGFLYPETYRFDAGSQPEAVVRRMLETFSSRAGDLLLGERADDRRFSVYEIVTLASIVQHESPTADMPEVAGVFDNRLREGMRLESDATVNYALGTAERRPTFAQVLTADPYNTYRQAGLPPGPIGNPGIDAISATVEPAEHSYLFFLHPLDGRTVLSETYEEHARKADRYLER